MPKYVDGFVIPIKKDKEEDYRQVAEVACAVWLEHGALDYFECVGDDIDVPGMVSFKTISGAADDETVIFAYIVYESREHRDAVNAKVMADERMKSTMEGKEMPFEMNRIAFGGFRTIVEAGK